MSNVDTAPSNGNPTAAQSQTHVILVIDASGSMLSLTDEVIAGVNGYLDELLADYNQTGQQYRISLVMFDHNVDRRFMGRNINETPRLSSVTYRPSGYTALMDAIGSSITKFEERTIELGDDERVLVVINTDGRENASREYTAEAVRKMIIDREATGRWSFVYLGQHADAWDQAESMGIMRANTVSLEHSGAGSLRSYDGLTKGTMQYSRGNTAENLADEIRKLEDEATEK